MLIGSVGIVYIQLITVWLALGSGALKWRLATSIALIGYPTMLFTGHLEPVPLAVAALAVVAIPCVVFRLFGRRVVRQFPELNSERPANAREEAEKDASAGVLDAADARSLQFSLQDLFILTTVAAVEAFCLKVTGVAQELIVRDPRDALISVAVLLGVGVMTYGCALAALTPGGNVGGRVATCAGLCGVAWGTILASILPEISYALLAGMYATIVTAVTGGLLAWARSLGFRLVRQ